jgi:hypothetical protein
LVDERKVEFQIMASIETLATFFGWCSVINIGFLLALLLRGFAVRKLSVRVFGVTAEEVKTAYLNVFMQYRNATLVLSVTPYIALKIMAW